MVTVTKPGKTGKPVIPSSAERHGGKKVELLSQQTISFNRPGSEPSTQAVGQTVPRPSAAFSATPAPGVSSTPNHAERDPGYMSVGLPSKFVPYNFKELSLKTLQGIHIAKFHRANKEDNLRLIVEAIGSTLEPGVSAFDLTPADFYYLMYWQRVNSFPKNRMLIETFCNDIDHNNEVSIGVKGPDGEFIRDEKNNIVKKAKETLEIKDYVSMTTLEIKDLEPFDPRPFAELSEKYGLGFETMQDVVDVMETALDMAQKSTDGVDEFMYTAARAAFLVKSPGRESLKARCAVVESMSADEVALLDEYREKITNYGVAEYAVVRCKECGASTKLKVSFDALTFLPGGR